MLIRATTITLVLILLTATAVAGQWSPERLLKAHLLDFYPWDDVELRDVRMNADVPGEMPSSIAIEKGPPGNTVFRMEFSGGDVVYASANVMPFDQVVMSRRPFKKGHTLRADDIYTTRKDVRRMPTGAVLVREEAVGKTLTRSVVASMPITEGMLSDTPMIKRGRKVSLIIRKAGFVISAVGITMENSRVGRHVKVMNLDSKRSLTGLLVDADTVEVRI